MARTAADPYAVKLSDDKRDTFARWLVSEIQAAEAARPIALADIEYWHRLYEQGTQKTVTDKPWDNAADLSSYIPTEKVDALRSRISRTIFTDPIWTVEGYGDASKRAPFVEEFHSWKAEEEGVQLPITDAIHVALIEGRGVLEVYEDTVSRLTRRTMRAALELTPDGRPILDTDGQFVLARGENGNYVEVADAQTPSAEVVVDTPERVRVGPGYRTIPYRDFLVLPGHASDKRDIWGYAKRFSRRLAELQDAAKRGVYDKAQVEALGTDTEVGDASTLSGEPINVASSFDNATTAEKVLWEVLLLHDFGDGERWYVATVSVEKHVLLRVRHDDLGPRYVCLIPFRRPGRALEGYSLVGHKLISVTEEHSAWRNMLADRAALVVNAPIKRQEGALWDPQETPFGPRAVIDVRDMNEVQAFVIPDLTNAAIEREREVLAASERVAGINDVAAGMRPQESRTLGEIQLVTEQSFVRMEEVVRNVQEALEDLGQIRHRVWQRVLAEQGDGIVLPERVLLGLEARAVGIQEFAEGQKFTAEMLSGVFKFKPRGSVETADVNTQRADFIRFMQTLAQMAQTWPALGAMLQGNKRAAQAMLAQALRLFRVSDKQAFIGSEAQAMFDQAMQPPPPQPGAQPGQPATPGGMPPQIAALMGGQGAAPAPVQGGATPGAGGPLG